MQSKISGEKIVVNANVPAISLMSHANLQRTFVECILSQTLQTHSGRVQQAVMKTLWLEGVKSDPIGPSLILDKVEARRGTLRYSEG